MFAAGLTLGPFFWVCLSGGGLRSGLSYWMPRSRLGMAQWWVARPGVAEAEFGAFRFNPRNSFRVWL